LVSAITAVAALLGTPVGLWVRRRGGRRALLAGLAVLAAAGWAGAAAPGVGWMLAARVAEGVGFLLVVVAAPTLMTQLAAKEQQPAVLALWGTGVAVGLAASAAAGGVLAPLGWRPWLALPGLLAVPLAAAVALLVPPDPPGHGSGGIAGGGAALDRGVPRTPPAGAADPPEPAAGAPGRLRAGDLRVPALLASGFCAVVLIASALLGMLPTFLVEERAGGNSAAGTATALVALSSVLGSLVAGWLLGRGLGPRPLLAAALLMPLAAFPVVRAGGSIGASVLAAATLLAANGVVIAAVFAAVPRMAAAPDHLAVVNGLIAQLGSAGTLLGPPLFALAVAAAGWGTFPPLVAAFTGLGLAALLLAEKGAAAR
ncbi:MAG TPA: MFS transporter, partial [Actinomycetes bacterium]|nr:MFS transporter [Actinomycetes bacterium]